MLRVSVSSQPEVERGTLFRSFARHSAAKEGMSARMSPAPLVIVMAAGQAMWLLTSWWIHSETLVRLCGRGRVMVRVSFGLGELSVVQLIECVSSG